MFLPLPAPLRIREMPGERRSLTAICKFLLQRKNPVIFKKRKIADTNLIIS